MSLRCRWLFFVLVTISLSSPFGCKRKAPPTNVVLVIVDTLRADHMSIYGYKRETTPNLDALAKEGIRFEHCIAPSPWTLPSVASILTGLWTHNHKAGLHLEPYTEENRHLTKMLDTVPTMAEVFRQRGYQTIGFFHNPFVDPGFGLERGFDLYDYFPGDNLNIRRVDAVVNLAIQWLKDIRNKKKGFFMVLHIFDPHLAYDPPVSFMFPYIKDYKGNLRPPFNPELDPTRQKKFELSEEDLEFAIGLYDGEISFVDSELGRFFDYLKSANLYENTIIIITSDHGEEFYEHGNFEHGHSLYREVLEVPLIIRLPEAEFANTVIKERVSNVDIFPSLVSYFDWSLPFKVDGTSFIVQPGTRISVKPHLIVSANLHFGPEKQALYSEQYKLILNTQTGGIEIYDLSKDPNELENIFGKKEQYPEIIIQQIKGVAATIEKLSADKAQKAVLDKETENKLRTLGYIK